VELLRLPAAPTQQLEGAAVRRSGAFPRLAPSPCKLPELRPCVHMAWIHVAVLGLENLVAGGAGTTRKSRFGFEKVIEAVQGCKKPFVELDVGGRSWEKRVHAGEM